jgi:hypothetical protein
MTLGSLSPRQLIVPNEEIMMPSTRQYPVSTNNISVLTTDPAKARFPTGHKVLAALGVLGLLILGGCGGAYQYQNAKPPNQPPYEKSFAQVQVFAPAGPSIPTGGTVLVSASAVYQVSPNSFTNTDVTKSATWATSDPAIATVNSGAVTGTGTGSVTISAIFGGKSGSTTIFVGVTNYITISPVGPFRLSATPETDFYATETFSDGSTLDVSGPATWTATPGGVFNIYPYLGGHAALVAPGTATVTATLPSGQSGSVQVTVVP